MFIIEVIVDGGGVLQGIILTSVSNILPLSFMYKWGGQNIRNASQ